MAKDRQPYQFDIGDGFCPFRRDVKRLKAHDAPILPLLDELDFSAGKRNWGYQLRRGLIPLAPSDADLLRERMVR